MSVQSVISAIAGHFNTNYSASAKFFQGQDYEPLANDNYAVLHVLPQGSDHAELTGDTTGIEATGIIRVNCYAEGGIGDAAGLADACAVVFDHATIGTVQMETGYAQDIGYNAEKQRWEMLYICEWYGK